MNDHLFNNKYRIPSARLNNWDYRSTAPYFVTICTKNRQHYFGYFKNKELHWNEIGNYSIECIENISIHSNCATIINQIVMPNHVHLLIELKNHTEDHLPNLFGPLLKKSLSSVINHFKGRITKFGKEKGIEKIWQPLFHDHIVRDEIEYRRIFDYITNNPANWNGDKFNG